MQDFKKLRAWHSARDLALEVIDALPERRARRVPGLRAQTIRAATSVSANLAEGCSRATRSEFLHFVEIALGSLGELEAHLLVGWGAAMLPDGAHYKLQLRVAIVRSMLIALQRTLQRRIAQEKS